MKRTMRHLVPVTALALTMGCSTGTNSAGGVGGETPLLFSYPEAPSANVRVSLTDAPSKDLKKVVVNVNHVELFVKKGANEGRIIVAQGLGPVDLLTLKNGVLLPIEDMHLAAGITITQMRMVLEGTGNESTKADDSICPMQTPSGQQSGIKIHLAQPVTLEANSNYSLVMDFDAAKSVVVKGTGDCLLKPVLKLLQVVRSVQDPVTGGEDDVPVTDGDTNVPDETGEPGFEPDDGTGVTDPPVITIEDTFNMP